MTGVGRDHWQITEVLHCHFSVSSVPGSLLSVFPTVGFTQSPLTSLTSCRPSTPPKRFALMGGNCSYMSNPNSEFCWGRRKSSKWFLITWI
ncbi:unnamed protein product [Pleuronectes platessa]|uniref:Uncharacterized protein n=1 Tax=Pleuronectes platessa TaxID=8262 RepID=A0A9N7USW7_PLEPL|nr:unnamed protein product [Pleuronectes platessa]